MRWKVLGLVVVFALVTATAAAPSAAADLAAEEPPELSDELKVGCGYGYSGQVCCVTKYICFICCEAEAGALQADGVQAAPVDEGVIPASG